MRQFKEMRYWLDTTANLLRGCQQQQAFRVFELVMSLPVGNRRTTQTADILKSGMIMPGSRQNK